MKWKIASLTLVTVPLAIWLSTESAVPGAYKFYMTMGMIPLITAAWVELSAARRLARENPEAYSEGSAAGNRVAAILAAVLLLLVLWGIYQVATLQP